MPVLPVNLSPGAKPTPKPAEKEKQVIPTMLRAELQRDIEAGRVKEYELAPSETPDISQIKPTKTTITSATHITAPMTPSQLYSAKIAEQTGGTNVYKQLGVGGAELLVPGVYSARHWGTMPVWEKALSIGLDVISVIPIIGAAGKGARTVTVAATRGARMARLGAAARGGGMELVRQVTWPVELAKSVGGIAKPVTVAGKTVTGARAMTENTRSIINSVGGRIKASLSGIETLVKPSKLPESVVFDAYHTIKIPLSQFKSVKQGLKAREALIRAAAKPGNHLIVDAGDNLLEIRRSALIRELKGGIAHATPQGDVFADTVMVQWKKGMPLREQGLFMSPESLERFAETSAYGVKGEMPTVIITSPEFAKKAKTTTKLYKGAIEAEAVYPVGTKIPKPKQKLYTRMGDTGQRIEIYLGKKLTKRQILKLKAEGLIESVKNFYDPVITIKSKTGKALTKAEVDKFADIIGQREKGLARNIRRVGADPSGMARVFQELRRPVLYRTVVDAKGVARVERIPEREAERVFRDIVREEGGRDTSRITREIVGGRRGTVRVRETMPRVSTIRGQARTRASVSRERIPSERREPPRQRETRFERLPRGGVKFNTPDGKEVTLTEAQLKRSFAWRQGFNYRLWYPPFNLDTLITVKERPPYVTEVVGEKSPQRSLAVQGNPKATDWASMGIVKVRVSRTGRGKGKLEFMRQAVSSSKK